jgi:hypothetical protein
LQSASSPCQPPEHWPWQAHFFERFGDICKLCFHGLGHGGRGGDAHGLQQILAVGEMAVSGIGRNTGTARGLAQHHCIGSAMACEFKSSL